MKTVYVCINTENNYYFQPLHRPSVQTVLFRIWPGPSVFVIMVQKNAQNWNATLNQTSLVVFYDCLGCLVITKAINQLG